MTPKLPGAMGSFAAIVVAFLGYNAQVTPLTCAVRSLSAFMVFAALGIVMRYLLWQAEPVVLPNTGVGGSASNRNHGIAPGASVTDALESAEVD